MCGSALTELDDPPPNYAVHGRDLMSGIPKEIIVTYKEIAGALIILLNKLKKLLWNALFKLLQHYQLTYIMKDYT